MPPYVTFSAVVTDADARQLKALSARYKKPPNTLVRVALTVVSAQQFPLQVIACKRGRGNRLGRQAITTRITKHENEALDALAASYEAARSAVLRALINWMRRTPKAVLAAAIAQHSSLPNQQGRPKGQRNANDGWRCPQCLHCVVLRRCQRCGVGLVVPPQTHCGSDVACPKCHHSLGVRRLGDTLDTRRRLG